MANKFTVDLLNKVIAANLGEHEIDVQTDLYSDLKEDWIANLNGEASYLFPIRTTGGDPISATLKVGAYFFLRNDLGWRIRPPEEDARVNIVGNLYPEDPDLPVFIPSVGGFTVAIISERSSLTQLATPRSAFTQGQDFPGFTFTMLSSTTRVPVAGLTVTGRKKVDGVWSLLANAVTADPDGGGKYVVDLSGSLDLTARLVTLEFTATGAVPRTVTIIAA